ncbi:hypothetical protein NP493_430g04006 [Ridgeia piscesae]|uniref:Uncharacterized protein n=1 Tax=Ridgeia piscesae TaxID=27915 RepID=A0AAD9MT64_RIDPI|nr:hypothetical protein NP493_4600g00001 [Ridgeia piscesae]KAK2143228.1 hypothetical protein NP493_4600g00003 [Ridgeia piscesae]KAK2180717.1 hypothetical protein NP493_430g04006 [Ridgeia piscesae]
MYQVWRHSMPSMPICPTPVAMLPMPHMSLLRPPLLPWLPTFPLGFPPVPATVSLTSSLRTFGINALLKDTLINKTSDVLTRSDVAEEKQHLDVRKASRDSKAYRENSSRKDIHLSSGDES